MATRWADTCQKGPRTTTLLAPRSLGNPCKHRANCPIWQSMRDPDERNSSLSWSCRCLSCSAVCSNACGEPLCPRQVCRTRPTRIFPWKQWTPPDRTTGSQLSENNPHVVFCGHKISLDAYLLSHWERSLVGCLPWLAAGSTLRCRAWNGSGSRPGPAQVSSSLPGWVWTGI